MKRPLFDMIDRYIMIKDNSFHASRMQLSIALARFKREIDRIMEPIYTPIIKWLVKATGEKNNIMYCNICQSYTKHTPAVNYLICTHCIVENKNKKNSFAYNIYVYCENFISNGFFKENGLFHRDTGSRS